MKSDTHLIKSALGDCAYAALQKHLKKTLKWESSVKKDEDPEALHQMRVGMRRLRSAVSGFASVIDLPKVVNDKNIGKIARCLGSLRDLDVLKEALESRYQPNLPPKEQKLIDVALEALEQQREDALADVLRTLKGERYKSLKQNLQDWLAEPSYQPIAFLPIQQVLPDLLLPEVSRFLLHSAWLVGSQVNNIEVIIATDLSLEQVETQLASQGKILHSLRKEAKRLRYQMELFSDFYGESYTAYLADVKHSQEILGQIQDSVVLAEWLADVLKSEINAKLPTLTAELAQNRYQAWQDWQILQQKFINLETRYNFHLTILQPQLSEEL